jgi:polysaccharide biosynthesis/export protein
LDENTTRALNAAVANNSGGVVPGTISGYLVDDSGLIKLPLLGAIKAEGYTKKQLEQLITNLLLEKQLAKDPVVVVRIASYKISVIGEVSRPGLISVPNERITLPEALAQAGDLTPYGRRDSVLLIREENGKRIFKRFSLNKGEMFNPDIYNLRNQDILYVSPSKDRAESTDRSLQYVSVGLSIVSLAIVVYLQVLK